MPSITDNEIAFYRAQTGLNDSINVMERAYWCTILGLPYTVALSYSDVKMRALTSLLPEYASQNLSISDLEYRYWWKKYGFNPDNPPYGLSISDLQNIFFNSAAIAGGGDGPTAGSTVLYYDTRQQVDSGGRLRNLASPKTGKTNPNSGVYLQGVSGNYISTPDTVANSITTTAGPLEIVMRVQTDDWTPTAQQALISKWAATPQRSWVVFLNTNGTLQFNFSTDGTNNTGLGGGAYPPLPFTDGKTYWIKVQFDTSGGNRTFPIWWANDQATEPTSAQWTQLTPTVISAGTSTLFDSTAPIELGTHTGGTLAPFKGQIFDSAIRQVTQDTTLDLQLGSAAGADTNDPAFLPYTGEPYVYISGNLNGINTPSLTNYNFTGDIEIVGRLACDDWTPAAMYNYVASKRAGISAEFFFRVDIATGKLGLFWYESGVSTGIVSSIAPTVTDGQNLWVKATRQNNDGTGKWVVKYYTAPDSPNEPTSWTQLGTDIVGAAPANPTATANAVCIACESASGGNSATGKYYEVIIRNAIGGGASAEIGHWRASQMSQTTMTDAQGVLWQMVRAATGRKTVLVTRPTFLFGTDDWMQTLTDVDALDFEYTTDRATVICSARHFATIPGWSTMYTKRRTGPAGWDFLRGTPQDRFLMTGTAERTVQQASVAANNIHTFFGYLDGPGGVTNSLMFSVDEASKSNLGASGSFTGSSVNAEVFYIGISMSGVSYADMEFYGGAIFRRVLADDERQLLDNYFRLGTNTAQARTLLESATAYWDAAQYNGAGSLRNLAYTKTEVAHFRASEFSNTSQTAKSSNTGEIWTLAPVGVTNLDAWAGNVKRAVIERDHVYLPGVAGNYISTPDTAALDLVDDMELIFHGSLDNWRAPASNVYLVTKTANSQISYSLNLQVTTGKLYFLWSVDGSTQRTGIITVAMPFVDGQTYWIKSSFDKDNGGGVWAVSFYWAPDQSTEPTQWTFLETITGAQAVGTPWIGTADLRIGLTGITGGTVMTGKVMDAIVRNMVNGQKVAHFRATDMNMDTMQGTGPVGNVWTVNRVTTTNDPTWCPFRGTKYMYSTSNTSAFTSGANQANFNVPGDLCLMALVQPEDWTPASANGLVVKDNGSAPNRCYEFRITTAGRLELVLFADGTTGTVGTSTVSVPAVDNQAMWVATTWRKSDGKVQFFTAPAPADGVAEPTSWNQLGADATIAIASIIAGTATPTVSTGPGRPFNGRFFRGIYKSGLLDGTIVGEFDASKTSQTGWVDNQGNTWTVNHPTTGKQTVIVDRSCYNFGVDDWMEVASDNKLLDIGPSVDFTAGGVAKQWHVPAGSMNFLTKRTGSATTDAGWNFGWNITQVIFARTCDGTSVGNGPALPNYGLGQLADMAFEVTIAGGQRSWYNGVIVFGAGITTDRTMATPLKIGKSSGGTVYGEFELYTAYVIRRLMTAEEHLAMQA